MQRYDVIRALGVEVLSVANLKRRALILDDENVALIRSDLGDEDHAEMADWLLGQALHRVTQNQRC